MIKEIKVSDTWDIRQHVMWPNESIEFVQLEDDDEGMHFGVFDNNTLVSIVSCFVIEREMQFRKLATLHQYQGKGYASSLILHIINLAKKNNIKKVWCNARIDKKGFYEKLQFVDTKIFFAKAGQYYTIMEKIL